MVANLFSVNIKINKAIPGNIFIQLEKKLNIYSKVGVLCFYIYIVILVLKSHNC